MFIDEIWNRQGWVLCREAVGDSSAMHFGLDFITGQMRSKKASEDETLGRGIPGLEGWKWQLYDDLSGNLIDSEGERRFGFVLSSHHAYASFLMWAVAYDGRLRKAMVDGSVGELPPGGDFPGELRVSRTIFAEGTPDGAMPVEQWPKPQESLHDVV